MGKARLLFTTSLSEDQNSLLKDVNFAFDVIPLIAFTQVPSANWISEVHKYTDAWVFTSKKAIYSVAEHLDSLIIPKYVFSVGEKTSDLLAEFGISAINPIDFNGKELGELIKEYEIKHVTHFCGNFRKSDVKTILAQNQIGLTELEVYITLFNSKKIDLTNFDGIIFMSPTAIRSFSQNNSFSSDLDYFAIGSTTANELLKLGVEKTVIPIKSTFEALIKKIETYYLA